MKVAEYINAGVTVVGVLDPKRRALYLYDGDEPVRILNETDELTLPTLLGDFRVVVGSFSREHVKRKAGENRRWIRSRARDVAKCWNSRANGRGSCSIAAIRWVRTAVPTRGCWSRRRFIRMCRRCPRRRCSTRPRNARVEAEPEQVAGYTIVRLLGRGGMGSVYEAEDAELGRRVALKLIAADHVASAEAVERFRQEGRLASTLAHPQCVFVFAADEERGRPYIVMELMPGQTLQTLVESNGPLEIVDAVTKTLDVIEGLQEAHHQGIIHRDVKPSNCFLEADGRVKVGDFGLSKSLDSDAGLTAERVSFIGTPLYASPEQIKRDDVNARTDVYSVSATLYYLLSGRPPFQADDAAAVLAKIVSEAPTPLRTLRPDVPAALEAAVMRGLEHDRDRRWQDLGRLRKAPAVRAGRADDERFGAVLGRFSAIRRRCSPSNRC